MKIIKEDSLVNFEFWSGAVDRANELTSDELEELDGILEDMYPNGMTDTEINDMFWFDFGYVCELLGLEYDEENDGVKRDDDEEEDDEE